MKMLLKQQVARVVIVALCAGCVVPAIAQDAFGVRPSNSGSDAGFYGGIALRDNAHESGGISLGRLTSAWSKFVAPTCR
jgi:hypothetical protein